MKRNIKTRLIPYRVVRTEELWDVENLSHLIKKEVRELGIILVGSVEDLDEKFIKNIAKTWQGLRHFRDEVIRPQKSIIERKGNNWILYHEHWMSSVNKICKIELILDET